MSKFRVLSASGDATAPPVPVQTPIWVGDEVTADGWAFAGIVTKIQVSNSAGPNYATVEFVSTGNIPGTYRQYHTTDKLRKVG